MQKRGEREKYMRALARLASLDRTGRDEASQGDGRGRITRA
jgi:hypothetical protein